MREIKFRAWDKKGKMMYKVALRDILEAKAELIMNCDNDVTAVMEFTGLKDKSGTEIYEGDILRFTNRQAVKSPFEVVWDEYYLEFNIRSKKHGLSDLYSGDEFRDGNTLTNAKVIGNIYQNPELGQTEQQSELKVRRYL